MSQQEWAREAKDLLGFAVPALAGKFFPWISHGSRCLACAEASGSLAQLIL